MDTEELLYDIVSVLKILKIDATTLKLPNIRNLIEQFITNNRSASRTRLILTITKLINDYYGLTPLLKSTPKATPVDIGLFNYTKTYSITNAINPSNLYKKAYVALDGMKATLLSNNKKISWNISDVRSDNTQVKNKFRDVVSVKLISSQVTLQVPAFTSTQITTVLIDELATQCFITKSRNYHFLAYDKLTTSEIIRITDIQGAMYNPSQRKLIIDNSCQEGIYYFDPPITVLDTLTFSFARPTIISTISNQAAFNSCLINLEIAYIDSSFEIEEIY
jgi:hypothetical protein